jgi:hypothetical protein
LEAAFSVAQSSTKAFLTLVPRAASGIGGEGIGEALAVLGARLDGERPAHRGLAGSDGLLCELGERVRRLLGRLERAGEAHVVGERRGAVVRGDDPVDEVERGLLVLGGGTGVDAPVVLGAGAQALALLVAHADVDGQEAEVVVAEGLDVLVAPGAVLVEDGVAVDELAHGVVGGLGGELRSVAGAVGDVEVEDVLVAREVGALDGVWVGDVVVLELEVEGHVGEVVGEAPARARVEARAHEGALDAQGVLAGLDVVGDLLEGGEVGDVGLLVSSL